MESPIICRFCAVKKSDTVTIDRVLDPIMFNEITETLNLLNFHTITLTDDDNLPKTVCGACYETLMETRSFLIKVRDAQIKLTSLITEKHEIKPEIMEVEIKVEKEDLVSDISECDALDNSSVPDKRKYDEQGDEQLVIPDNEASWSVYPWNCGVCSCVYPDIDSLREHLISAHRTCAAFKCVDCSKIYQNFQCFINHVKQHRPYLRHYCQYCNFKFDTDNVSDHITSHFTSLQYTCACCGETFTDQDNFTRHKKLYSPGKPKRVPFKKRDKPISVQDLTCDVCHKVARSLSNLLCHKKIHTERQRNHTCDRCGKAYYTKDTLVAHAIVHDNPAPQVCKICDKSFLTIGRLRKHVSTHYTEKPFQCDHCKRGFRLKDQLKNHMIIHSDVMPYKCGYCEKRFRHRHVMRTHENQHTNARPYACTVCTMDFNNWSNCNKHMKRKHGKTLAKSMLTSKGKLSINPATGEPMQVTDLNSVSDWTEKILAPLKRGKKGKANTAAILC